MLYNPFGSDEMPSLSGRIITLAVAAPERMGTLFVATFGADHGVELEQQHKEPHEPLDLRA